VGLSARCGLEAWIHWSCMYCSDCTVLGLKSVEELYPSPPLGVDSAETSQLPKEKNLHRQFQYFQITQPGSSTVTPLYQLCMLVKVFAPHLHIFRGLFLFLFLPPAIQLFPFFNPNFCPTRDRIYTRKDNILPWSPGGEGVTPPPHLFTSRPRFNVPTDHHLFISPNLILFFTSSQIFPTALIKKKIKFSSYIRKFRMELLQSYI
jgi:hypothetical protein